VVAPEPDGRLQSTTGLESHPPYVAAPTGIAPVGEPVATLPPSFEQAGMVLWKTISPLRISYRIAGFKPNGDVYGHEPAVVRVYGCDRGSLELTLLGKQGLPTRILLDGKVVAEHAVAPGEVWRPSIPAPTSADGSRSCVYTIASDGLIGSTRVEFVRSS
jgi:hypothetical protein